MNIVYGFNRIKTWKSNIDIPKADNVNDITHHTTSHHTAPYTHTVTPRKSKRFDEKSVACSLDNLKFMIVLSDDLKYTFLNTETIQRHGKAW